MPLAFKHKPKSGQRVCFLHHPVPRESGSEILGSARAGVKQDHKTWGDPDA